MRRQAGGAAASQPVLDVGLGAVGVAELLLGWVEADDTVKVGREGARGLAVAAAQVDSEATPLLRGGGMVPLLPSEDQHRLVEGVGVCGPELAVVLAVPTCNRCQGG